MITKASTEGGKKELELSEKYLRYASIIRDQYPRTSTMLRRIAAQYREFAKREDENVEKMYFLDS